MKRSFWRIHLITAVVLMFVVGGTLGQNLKETSVTEPLPEKLLRIRQTTKGWPLAWYKSNRRRDVLYNREWLEMPDPYLGQEYESKPALAIDIAINLALALGALVACEYYLRRLEPLANEQ
jgi:hypothetical protein